MGDRWSVGFRLYANRMPPLLHLSDFRVATPSGYLTPPLTMDVNATEAIGLAGPSGVGKSLCVLALLGQLDGRAGWKISGTAHFRGEDLIRLPQAQKRALLGTQIGYVPQQTAISLDPLHPVGVQVGRLYQERIPLAAKAAEKRFRSILAKLGLTNIERVCRGWPRELSGGEVQRILLAITLAMEPALVVADEPTAHLDPATEREFLNLILALKRELGFGLVVVSHREALLAGLVDCVVHLARDNQSASPNADRGSTIAGADQSQSTRSGAARLSPRLHVQEISVRVEKVVLLNDISFQVWAGEVVGVVGKSGAGKSVLARTLAGVASPSHGRIDFIGKSKGRSERLDGVNPDVQLIFQEPIQSFDPLRTVASALVDAARRLPGSCVEQESAIRAQLAEFDLDPALAAGIPSALSGGEIQRMAIARALLARPSIIIADEPTSSLDSQTASKVLQALHRYVRDQAAALIIVSHDLSSLWKLCDHVIVMADGEIRESAPAARFFSGPNSTEGLALIGAARLR
jgi:ABC-type glutathione transport system ATPase component